MAIYNDQSLKNLEKEGIIRHLGSTIKYLCQQNIDLLPEAIGGDFYFFEKRIEIIKENTTNMEILYSKMKELKST